MTIANQYSEDKQRLVIPLGDPAGIGAEVTLKALGSTDLPPNIQPVLIGCKQSLEKIYSKLKSNGVRPLAEPKNLEVLNMPLIGELIPGRPTAKTGDASFRWLTRGIELLMQGEARALITAPIAKSAWHEAGHLYAGQTERLAEITGVKYPSMLFTAVSPKSGWRINTLLATTHIPLSDVPKKLTPELINFKLDTLLEFCKRFKSHPKLAVAGLNPHAGENGKIGEEEMKWLNPVLKKWKDSHSEIILEGTLPPDTCWLSAAKAWAGKEQKNSPDGILALYHDQGLIPMKLIAFDFAVNTTLGLPFIRTSPDHGTAFDIAGKGLANEKSMLAAIKTAWDLTQ